MGLINGVEAGIGRIDKTFTATGRSEQIMLHGLANLALWGGEATVQLEKSYDDGVTWIPCSRDTGGSLARWEVTEAAPVAIAIYEPENGVVYALNCTAFTSDTRYRISQ